MTETPKPWVMVDGFSCTKNYSSATLIKLITESDYFLQGHFPQYSIYPGLLLVECIRQGAERLLVNITGDQSLFQWNMVKNSTRFTRPVLPGDTVLFELNVVSFPSNSEFKINAVGYVNEKIVIRSNLILARKENASV
ncbi:3-hydroxyacyl-[acyl-carrier-protein] dehydratase [Paenibacillus cellulosilyticus]|uniref:3-hydroxyacyl-[acyl-carrier-protein] dehydratase n=1 Tax=Paenibacillus cellulosilyticus TaxID=375489 RepID=A0A2V2YUC2_9BACL|nr:FabA-like domain protein [Paenibacillus cellulosilyticus]PWW03188.1 3-hydroxyacyl-[acyl-carrier-protein] dehydratase [Paenibacillus cellulosilyticus]QKS43678.1 FabA-like domain protein [Paenibacillus cellulosilyticus]